MTVNAGHDLNLIAAYAEDRLSADDRDRATAHLAACADCRAVLAGLIRAGLPESQHHERPRSYWLRPAMSVAAMLLIGVGAALTWYFRAGEVPSSPSVEVTGPTASPPPVSSSPGPPQTGAPPADLPPAVTRSAAERSVGGKTFRLVAGEWVDTTYDPFALLPVEIVRTAQERNRAVEKVPALRPYTALGPRVTVVLNGVVYKFEGIN